MLNGNRFQCITTGTSVRKEREAATSYLLIMFLLEIGLESWHNCLSTEEEYLNCNINKFDKTVIREI